MAASCDAIKSHPALKNTPVIIYSAYINNNSELLAYGCGWIIQ